MTNQQSVMKQRKLLTVLGLLIVALAGISFFLPRDLTLSVTRVIDASPEQVFAQVNRVENWPNWAPWFSLDPDMEVTYGEMREGKGASYAWTSEKRSVGNGAMIIDESVPNEKVGTVLKFEHESDSYADISLAPVTGGTEVTWKFESDYRADMPWQRYRMAFFYLALKGAYKKGLSNLESWIGEHPDDHLKAMVSGPEPVETTPPAFNAVTALRWGSISRLDSIGQDLYGSALAEVMDSVERSGLQLAGYPVGVVVLWDEAADSFAMEIGMQVAGGGRAIGGVETVKVKHFGPYEGLGTAHDAIAAYMKANGLALAGSPWEVYVTDPSAEPDTSRWLTEVFYPVAPQPSE